MGNEVKVWNKVMSAAMDMPYTTVNREQFLRKELQQYCSPKDLKRAIKNPVDVLTVEQIDNLAKACINNHLWKVSSLSFVAGLPGGWALVGTIPADVAQYFSHTLAVAQKLAYLYGFPDLRDENGNMTETSQDLLTLFVGVMMGVGVANNTLKQASQAFAIQVAKRLPQKALTKTAWYPVIKQVAKMLGVKLTKDTFSKGLSKAIPILGGVLSGTLTAVTFKPAASRFQRKLREQMCLIHHSEGDEDDYDEAIYTEVIE